MRFFRLLAVLGLLLLCASSALALDCTPFHSSNGPDSGYLDFLSNTPHQPGEIICGHDLTGWTLFVIEFTVSSPGMGYVTAVGHDLSGGGMYDTAIVIMDDCAAGSCTDFAQTSLGQTELYTCLDAGSYMAVIAVNTTDPSAYVGMGFTGFAGCNTAAYLQSSQDQGIECTQCAAVGVNSMNWSALKGQYQN